MPEKFENEWTREIERLTRENKIFKVKTANSLANNLCPDHRDKQAGKLCLACEIDRLQAENKELLEACREMRDFYGDSGWMVDNGLSIALTDLFGKHYNKMNAAIAAAERKEP